MIFAQHRFFSTVTTRSRLYGVCPGQRQSWFSGFSRAQRMRVVQVVSLKRLNIDQNLCDVSQRENDFLPLKL